MSNNATTSILARSQQDGWSSEGSCIAMSSTKETCWSHIRRQRVSRVADVLNKAGENEEKGRRRPRQSDIWASPGKVRVAQVCGYGYKVG